MAARGKASTSSTGASMSKYDVEVEARLQALEAAVKELQSHSHDAPAAASGGAVDDASLLKSEQFKGLAEDVARMRKTLGI